MGKRLYSIQTSTALTLFVLPAICGLVLRQRGTGEPICCESDAG
jgi:hypothetical protein